MRAMSIVLLLATSCVIIEADTGIPERDCGEDGKTPDDGRCHCDGDCHNSKLGAVCLSEYAYGWPGGSCTRTCKLDTDCDVGFICDGICSQVCSTSNDCAAGRMCRMVQAGRPSTCMSNCDEDADCDNLSCNVYSGMCRLNGGPLQGAGLNAPCTADDQCLSNRCSDGVCITPCDTTSPHCPEGGACVRGWCENACAAAGGCALNQSCVETDAGLVCSQ